MPSALAALDEPNSSCGVLHVGQRKYDWLRTRPIIFHENIQFLEESKKAEIIRG
jgi:hypothetical protein